MRHFVLLAASSLALAACGGADTNPTDASTDTAAQTGNDYGYDTYGEDNLADTMASNDDAAMANFGNESGTIDRASAPVNGESSAGAATIEDSEERPVMQAQVVLDRQGWGPGVIDGKMGMSTENALRGFQEANDLEVSGKLDDATKSALAEWDKIPATRIVTIPTSWSEQTYTDMPEDVAAKAKLDRLGYKSLEERLAERFHTTAEVLKTLNPGGKPAGQGQRSGSGDSSDDQDDTATQSGQTTTKDGYFAAGQQIRVPNIGADRIAKGAVSDRSWQQTLASLGVGTEQPEVDRIVVSKSKDTLRAYQGEKLVALFTVSSGSSEFPLPIGNWEILGEAYNPPYSYDPEVLGNDDAKGNTYQLPPGPNGPVGVIWIDLSKEHYGIHGTPDPETIGRAQSSGCVRLTNWDAARLSEMVSTDTKVVFEA
ncbi:L,D-transpeptidase family protein [Altererythrobacter sp.]|nr:L,D-transpeptidase family protein [Altererythrobacter sp.]